MLDAVANLIQQTDAAQAAFDAATTTSASLLNTAPTAPTTAPPAAPAPAYNPRRTSVHSEPYLPPYIPNRAQPLCRPCCLPTNHHRSQGPRAAPSHPPQPTERATKRPRQISPGSVPSRPGTPWLPTSLETIPPADRNPNRPTTSNVRPAIHLTTVLITAALATATSGADVHTGFDVGV